MQKFAKLTALLFLAACASMDVQDASLESGEYRIAAMEIVPGSELPAGSVSALNTFRPVLQAKIEEYLPHYGKTHGRDVWLSIQVKKLDIEVSGGQAILIGDRRQVRSEVQLLEPQTRRVLATSTISNYNRESGIAGLLTNNVIPETMVRNLARDHALRILDQLP